MHGNFNKEKLALKSSIVVHVQFELYNLACTNHVIFNYEYRQSFSKVLVNLALV